MRLSIDDIEDALPYYLTRPQKEGLVKALAEFPNCNFYSSRSHSGYLQGDVWSKFDIVNFTTGERRVGKGIILSNSCDIDPANLRAIPGKVVFAPLIDLDRYSEKYRQAVGEPKLISHLGEIRKQKITSIFYLPAGRGLTKEHIVRLDDVHSLPASYFIGRAEQSKISTLSQVGFYVFLMKLSIHFCRMHEGEIR